MDMVNYAVRRIGIPHYPWPVLEYNRQIDAERKAQPPLEQRKILLYVHIPFCEQLCCFCPYPRIKNTDSARDVYFQALKTELAGYATQLQLKKMPVQAVYFGGGTPSVLTSREIRMLFDFICSQLHLEEVREITFEANPHSLSREKIRLLKALGINRVSLGIQTFHKKINARLGLIQSPRKSLDVIKQLQDAGMENISIDLMYNLPGQGEAEWESDLALAAQLGVDHISLFPLKLLPFLGLYRKIAEKVIPGCGDIHHECRLFTRACLYLESGGYHIVSTYDFCRPGKEHIYAENHFTDHYDLLAAGMGSFGEIAGFVYKNKTGFNEYCNAVKEGVFPVHSYYKTGSRQLPARLMTMGLRFLKVDIDKFRQQCGGHPADFFAEKIESLTRAGFLEEKESRLALTRWKGITWGNNICFEFADALFAGAYPP